MSLRNALLVCVLLVAPSAYAQAPAAPLGMSRAAFVFSLAGVSANVATTEIAFAKFHVYHKLVGTRVRNASLNLALPLVMKPLLRKTPRDQANAAAITVGAWGVGYATWNVVVMVRY